MYKIKQIALILSLFAIVSGLGTADGIAQKHSRYYDFSVSFKCARYCGEDEEILERNVGEPLEDATDYMASWYKNKWCDCVEGTEMDTAKVYRDTECEDYSSIIVLTHTGTYIRAHFYCMLEYNAEPNMNFGMVRDIFLLDNKKLEKVKVHDINSGAWRIYDSFLLEKKNVKRCEELLSIQYPRVNELDPVSFDSDFMLKITLFYPSGELHTIGIDMLEHRLYAHEAQFQLTEDQYADWLDALGLHGLDKSWF